MESHDHVCAITRSWTMPQLLAQHRRGAHRLTWGASIIGATFPRLTIASAEHRREHSNINTDSGKTRSQSR